MAVNNVLPYRLALHAVLQQRLAVDHVQQRSRVILAFSPSTWLFNAFSEKQPAAVAVFSWQRAVLTYDQQTPACPLASVHICQLVMAAGGSSQLLRAQSSALPAAAE